MSLIAECPFPFPTTDLTSVDFGVASITEGAETKAVTQAQPNLLWGWQISPDIGVYAAQRSAGIGISVPPDMRMRDLTLKLAGHAELAEGQDLTLDVRVNGVRLALETFTNTDSRRELAIRVPASVVDLSPEGHLVLRLDAVDDENQDPQQPMFFFPELLDLLTATGSAAP